MKAYVIEKAAKQDQTPDWAPVWAFPTRGQANAARGEFAAQRGVHGTPDELVISEIKLGPVKAARARTRAARKALYEALRAEFLAACLELFRAHPELESFSWRQEVYDDFRNGHWFLELYQPTLKGGTGVDELDHLVMELTDLFDEYELEDLFGDMNLVTVHRDGTVENEENYSDD